MHSPIAVAVSEANQIGEARRAAVRAAAAIGFDEVGCGEVAIVASELATNLAHHARDGRLFIQGLTLPAGPCIELLSVDSGPGMADVGRCLSDGYSTAGTPGNGLGAIRRLSTTFDIYSRVDSGTVVLSRVVRRPQPATRRATYEWGALSTPAPRESVSGDAWRVAERDGDILVMVADGLGHGLHAAEAAQRAARCFDERANDEPLAHVESAHRALVGSRGAAIACAHIARTSVRYSGVGNISGTVVNANRNRGMANQNGTAGVQMRKAQQFEYEWPAQGLLVMHSDGLTNRWSLDIYPGLIIRHPAIVAAVLWRDCGRGRDDATIVVVGHGRNAA